MSKSRSAIVALCCAGLLASVATVSAQEQKKSKISREEAWSRCTAEVSVIPADQHGQRYARGAACMKKYGYKI